MERKGYEDGWGARIFVLVVRSHSFVPPFILRELSRAAAKEKKFDWFSCDFDAWVSHSLFFFFSIIGRASFF